MKNLPNVDDLKETRKNKRQEVLKQITKKTNELLKDPKELIKKVLMANNLGEASFNEPIQGLYRELMNSCMYYDYFHGNPEYFEKQVGDIYCKMFNDKFGHQGYKAVRSGSIVIISWED